MNTPDQSAIALGAEMLSCMARRDIAGFSGLLATISGESHAKDIVIAMALLYGTAPPELDSIAFAASLAAQV